MAPAKLPTWRKERGVATRQSLRLCFICFVFILLVATLLCLTLSRYSGSLTMCKAGQPLAEEEKIQAQAKHSVEFDCLGFPQTGPVVANQVEKVRHPFFISIADLGSLEKPNRNIQRILKGKLFQRPSISETVQALLEKMQTSGFAKGRSLVLDVGANVGMATFAAAAMGYKVLAFEPVPENIYKLCDGVYLNRATSLVTVYNLAVSDSPGNITLHKVVGRLDNSAVSETGAKLAFKSNEVIPISIRAITLDSMFSTSSSVLLLKIDVQGWEYHVLRGASKLLSQPSHEAPYIIYEEDERLLQESNTTSQHILQFLGSHGYKFCFKDGNDRHCAKEKLH